MATCTLTNSGSSGPAREGSEDDDSDGSNSVENEGALASLKHFLEERAQQAIQPRHDPWKIQTREDGTFMVLETQVPFPKIAYN